MRVTTSPTSDDIVFVALMGYAVRIIIVVCLAVGRRGKQTRRRARLEHQAKKGNGTAPVSGRYLPPKPRHPRNRR